MKYLFTLIIFSVISFSSFSQNTEQNHPEVLLEQHQSDNGFSLEFINQRDLNPSKMEAFKSRLTNHYSELESIDYNQNDDKFILKFSGPSVSNERLDDILIHFHVFNYKIVKK
ncbi:MAG: hypothetical protein R3277_10480 [Brumimicrobium sp.]|nr:hypothetical protein [Brumimicrobium sp.]